MNRQVNPDHCYETEDGALYMLAPAAGTPEWRVMKDGRVHRTFTSLMAAKGWLEHVLQHPSSDTRPDAEALRAAAPALAALLREQGIKK